MQNFTFQTLKILSFVYLLTNETLTVMSTCLIPQMCISMITVNISLAKGDTTDKTFDV